jgi:hypothetical protein
MNSGTMVPRKATTLTIVPRLMSPVKCKVPPGSSSSVRLTAFSTGTILREVNDSAINVIHHAQHRVRRSVQTFLICFGICYFLVFVFGSGPSPSLDPVSLFFVAVFAFPSAIALWLGFNVIRFALAKN